MAQQNMTAVEVLPKAFDPRYPAIFVFAALCILAFLLSAVYNFFGGNPYAAASRISQTLTGLFSGNWRLALDFSGWVMLLFPLLVIMRLVSWTGNEGRKAYAGNLINDATLRNFFFEMLLLALLGYAFWFVIGNAIRNLEAQNIASGFDFLGRTAGFQINQSPFIGYKETSSYGMVYWVGLQNTLVVAFVGIILATLLGFTVGIARLSSNFILSKLAYGYVEVMRNVPLLLWIFIWYFSVLRQLPDKGAPVDFGPLGQLSIAGYFAPKPVFGPGAGWIGLAFLTAVAASFGLSSWARKRQNATGRQFPVFRTSLCMIVALPLLAYLATGMPVSFDMPTASKFGAKGGMRVFPEFIGLTVALVTYTAAYIAEIVRAGILAVNKGQSEASYALGLRPGTALRLVVVPQAMRVIIPPLTSQFLNLTKNSSLAVAVAYPDLVAAFMGTTLNQTGQAVEIILITMLTYLTVSLVTSFFMNQYNARVALIER